MLRLDADAAHSPPLNTRLAPEKNPRQDLHTRKQSGEETVGRGIRVNGIHTPSPWLEREPSVVVKRRTRIGIQKRMNPRRRSIIVHAHGPSVGEFSHSFLDCKSEPVARAVCAPSGFRKTIQPPQEPVLARRKNQCHIRPTKPSPPPPPPPIQQGSTPRRDRLAARASPHSKPCYNPSF
jgi:hypothetical protein